VTYTQLANFTDSLDQSAIAVYQNGDFPHADDPSVGGIDAFAATPFSSIFCIVDLETDHAPKRSLIGADKIGHRCANFADEWAPRTSPQIQC
jgi:hypothetical protein